MARWNFDGWYYRTEGHRSGPLSTTQVRNLIESGTLQPRDQVWVKWTQGSDAKLVATQAATALEAREAAAS